MQLSLNGFRVELSAPTFTAHVADIPQPTAMRQLREEKGRDWFLYWRAGKAFGLPRVARPQTAFGLPVSLTCAHPDHLHVLAARIADVLPAKFPKYRALRRRPFAFLAQKDELVSRITDRWKVPPITRTFEIRPKFELDPRLVELVEGTISVALFVQVNTGWEIKASLADLIAHGVDLTGLHVIRRSPAPGQRRLVGRISQTDGSIVHFAEAFDGLQQMPAAELALEGSKASFARCLRTLLGDRAGEFEEKRYVEEGRIFTGPSLHDLLLRMEGFLRKASPLDIGGGLECTFGDRIALRNHGDYKSVVSFDPVEYCYDVAKSKRHEWAWVGLERFGPYSRDSKKSGRILIVCPDTAAGKVGQFVKNLRDGLVSAKDSRFAKGFAGTFGLINPSFDTCTVPLHDARGQLPATLYRKAVEEHLAAGQQDYDAAIVVILDEQARLPDDVNPYLHAKAVLLMASIPVQEARLSTITTPHTSLQYTLQNLSVALYAKMGGVPWTVDHDLTVDDEIVIGMGTAELTGSRFDERQRHVGITTVFRGDGNYLLSNLSKECRYDEYPEVLMSSTLEVLSEIKSRNGWRLGDTVRLVFHIFKPLRNIEVADLVKACVDQVGKDQKVQFAFLTVSHDHPFKILDQSQPGVSRAGGTKARYVPVRGTMAQLGRYTRLLCANGPSQIKRPSSPLPRPLLVHLHPQSTYPDLSYLTEQVLKFTSLTWRSTQPCENPVTIYYSDLIAELLGRLRAVPGWSPMVLNSKLRHSKWFL